MAKILKEIGQCAVVSGGVEYVFTPSFINIAQIGEPDEIIRKFNYILDRISINEISTSYNYYTKAVMLTYISRLCLGTAIEIMECCCDKNLPESLIGGWDSKGRYVLSDKKTGIPPSDILVIASMLMKYGLIGDAEARSNDGDASVDGFSAYKFISFAISNFGCSREDAKNMTMVDFQNEFNRKFPAVKEKEKDKNDANDADDYFSKIDALRKRNAELNNG